MPALVSRVSASATAVWLAQACCASAAVATPWVIVQVQARGLQVTEQGGKKPLEFVSAWIELYEKRNGRWYRVGNVSNFRP